MKTVELTEDAAKVLDWFKEHEMYGDTPSEIILQHAEEWCSRDGMTLDEMLSQ